MQAVQQRDAPNQAFPSGFSPESALAVLRPCRAHTRWQARVVTQADSRLSEFPATPLRIENYSRRHAPCHHPILD
ncbi:hypothetical protein Q8A64_10235 [Oxalobacteraceae bacterium R-40]|uniref:Uncharacterized protein n=1 Tax=Keguizhuia sedimenti TaxID=3064264 RepID=A0ABU1BP72_9BURK|nr:hypothetical protein [Oxalobacteraceae bacterium R-40]